MERRHSEVWWGKQSLKKAPGQPNCPEEELGPC